MEAYSIQD